MGRHNIDVTTGTPQVLYGRYRVRISIRLFVTITIALTNSLKCLPSPCFDIFLAHSELCNTVFADGMTGGYDLVTGKFYALRAKNV
jgi:hypothetical protein